MMANAQRQPQQIRPEFAWQPPQKRTGPAPRRPAKKSYKRHTPSVVYVRQPTKPTAAAPPSLSRDLGALAIKIAAISLGLVLMFTLVYGFHRHTGPEMAPMIKDGDVVLFYRLSRDYAIGDLLLLDFQGERQVRRVVAQAGDTVDITDDGLIINGGLQHEPDIFQQTWRYANGISFPLTVEEGQIFVLGDAREIAATLRARDPRSREKEG